jgi:hypothetical protein
MESVFLIHTVQRRRSPRTQTYPYEYMYAIPTTMSTSERLSTGRSGDSRSHHWRLVVNGNVAYHLTHNAGKSRNKSKKRCEHQDLKPIMSRRPATRWPARKHGFSARPSTELSVPGLARPGPPGRAWAAIIARRAARPGTVK